MLGKEIGTMKYWTILLAAAAACTALGQEREGAAPQGSAKSAHQLDMEEGWRLNPTLKTGDSAPDFDLPGTDGKKHSLADWKNSPVLAVVFMCNYCPASQLYEGRIKKIVDDYRSKGGQVIGIQPNAVAALTPRELNYTDVDDSLKNMAVHAQFQHFNFPCLYDGDTQQIAHLYGPKKTPHIFIFDKDRKLRYEGRIDDNMREAAVKTQDTRAALDDLAAGRPVQFPQRPVFGCSIKWKQQTGRREDEERAWKETPVKLEMADASVLKKLRQNGTGKTVMIALWATWCGPCVEEFDDLLQTHLWYRSRDLELVTVATNAPDEKAAVMLFLNEHHSAVRNYIFASEGVYALQEAFDKSWDSGVPFTMVIAPDGKVIYWEEGEISLKMRRVILANLPDMGYTGTAAYWAKSISQER
jgi:peroxiredoxin